MMMEKKETIRPFLSESSSVLYIQIVSIRLEEPLEKSIGVSEERILIVKVITNDV